MIRGGILLVLFLLASAGCERQIPILGNPAINGYEVQGTVTDQVGNPIPNVKVFVDYSAEVSPPDSAVSRSYFVAGPIALVQAIVVDWQNHVVRILAPLRQYSGEYEAIWDGKDSTGSVPPSGIYYVQYLVDGVVRFSYNQLVNGGQVAETDLTGQYTIPIQFLPIDSSSVPYFSPYDSSYVGNLLISNFVFFTYTYTNHTQQVARSLDKGQVTFINITFH